jgi:hypothetical protein
LPLSYASPLAGDKDSTPVNEDKIEEVNQVSLAALEVQVAELTEEKCELEEAENDSRLRAQVA